jgi:membrane-associated phospholipid phosphatase
MLKKLSPIIFKISNYISNLFNPLFSLFLYFTYVTIKLDTFSEGIKKFLVLFFILILPVSLWIYKGVKSGKYSDADVSNREERKSLYYFISIILAIYILINFFIYHRFDKIMLFLILLIFVMQISNLFIKSSMHTALNIFTAVLFFSQNHMFGIIWLMISFVVGFTRIILKKHTFQEVLSGTLIASIISILFLNFNLIS